MNTDHVPSGHGAGVQERVAMITTNPVMTADGLSSFV